MDRNQRVLRMVFADIYELLCSKVERKGHLTENVMLVIQWLTGYSKQELDKSIEDKVTFEQFFARAPQINPKAKLIKGNICGYKIQEIQDPFMWKVRCMDKLVDDLSKGKSLEKVLPAG